MSKITIDMPPVKGCSATECAFNLNRNCHAKAVTIGDSRVPRCDTFFPSAAHNVEAGRIAGVGACKVSNCQFNANLECTASEIKVGKIGDSAHCMAFKERAVAA